MSQSDMMKKGEDHTGDPRRSRRYIARMSGRHKVRGGLDGPLVCPCDMSHVHGGCERFMCRIRNIMLCLITVRRCAYMLCDDRS